MMHVFFGAVAGGAFAALAQKLRDTFWRPSGGIEAIELTVGLAYLHMLTQEYEDVPAAASIQELRAATDPVAALEEALAALERSDKLREHATLLRSLRLTDKVERLLGTNGSSADFRTLLDGSALSDDSEAILEAVEAALSAAMSGAGRFRGGEYYTPPLASELMVRLLAPSPGSRIYDPTCGTGGLLVKALDYATKDGGPTPELFGQDINPAVVALARVRTHLRGVRANIALGDLLTEPRHVRDGELERFDFVIADLPLGVKLRNADELGDDRYQRFDQLDLRRRTAGDAAFLAHALASVADGGRAVLTAGPHLLRGGGANIEVGKQLVQTDLLEAVILVPGRFFEGMPLARPLLIVNHAKPPALRGKVLLIEADTQFHDDPQALIDRIVAEHQAPKGVRRFSTIASVEDIANRDFDLRPASYIALYEVDRYMGGRGEKATLGEIAKILRSRRLELSQDGSEPIVTARDLRDGYVSLAELERVSIHGDRSDVLTCQVGDILLPEVSRGHAVVEVPEELEGALVDASVLVIRLNDDQAHLTGYLCDFLRSDLGSALLAYTSSRLRDTARISQAQLSALTIPVPDPAMLKLVDEIRRVEREVRDRSLRASQLRARLFTLDEPEAFDEEIRRLKTESEVLGRSLVQVDSLSYRIRNFYPFPVAYRYRELEGLGEPHHLHKAMLGVAEATLAYLGSFGLALAAHVGALDQGHDLSQMDLMRDRLWRSGASLDDWRELAFQSAKAIRQHGAKHVLPSVATDYSAMWFQGRSHRASDLYEVTLKRTVQIRNDAHHERGPSTPPEYERENEELRSLLDVVFGALEWTVNYPLRCITRTQRRWEDDVHVADTVLFTGDHPALRREQVPVPQPLHERHLYLEASETEWISLYPLITVQYCPSCKRSETYYIDRWGGADASMVIKSFERGHVLAYKHREGESAEARLVSTHLEAWFRRVAAVQ